jgi:Ca-activated chloride channel homolog
LNGAEALRASAEKSLAEIETAIKANKDPLTPAKEAEAKLLELRKLFFNVVEHLQQLLKDQNETKDQTSQANTEDDFTRAPKLPKLATDEGQHGQLAKEISDALAKQADAGAKGQGEQQDQAKKFAAAAEEVRLATTDMGDAKVGLDKAATAKQSVSLEPPVKSEAKAVEHLENALKILQPPQKNDQQKQDDKKQDQQKQDQQKKQDQQQQQGGAGQRARDEDAKRQREKQQQGQDAPVDKDW